MKFLHVFAITIAISAALFSMPSAIGPVDVGRALGGFAMGMLIGALFLSPAHYVKNRWARFSIKAVGLSFLAAATFGQSMNGGHLNTGGVAALLVVFVLAVFRKPKHEATSTGG